jgi:SAM-dependent methyltransferase
MKSTAKISPRKARVLALSERQAHERQRWRARSAYFHEEDTRYLRFLIPAGARVLDLGCATGATLAALHPAYGVGVDFSAAMIAQAQQQHPDLHFVEADVEDTTWLDGVEGPFDFIVIADTIGSLDDCQQTFRQLHRVCGPRTRIVVAYYAYFWEPVLRLAEMCGRKMPTELQNVLSTEDISCLLDLAGFQVLHREWRQLIPKQLGGLGPLLNRYLGTLPGVRRMCLRNYVVARSVQQKIVPQPRSATVVIPCRNERGNIEPAIARMPRFCDDLEIIFVEGHSTDGTFQETERVRDLYAGQWDIKLLRQDGKGKADAVFKGFDAARGEVLMILDADLTVAPAELGKFFDAIASGQGEYVQGTRLVYPLDQDAMRFLNLLANWCFSKLFTWLLNQRITDTLCGTKVLLREDYLTLKANRHYFGDFDPFGDFDLIFGASKMNLKILEIPIRYAARQYGETQISRFRHGLMLLRMVIFAYRRLKAF